MRSRFNGAGYYLNDDRESGGGKTENDVLTCGHCQAIILRSEWREDGCHCWCCDSAVGVRCGCAARMITRGCENFVRRVEAAIERKYQHEQNARILGTRDIL